MSCNVTLPFDLYFLIGSLLKIPNSYCYTSAEWNDLGLYECNSEAIRDENG